MGISVASRALRVATTGMVGLFTISIGMIFYSTQTSSVTQAIQTIQQSSRQYYRRWDDYIRTLFHQSTNHNDPNTKLQHRQQRYDEHHPEYQKIQTMTEEEELEYIYQTYIVEQSSSSSSSGPSSSLLESDTPSRECDGRKE
jgi:type II secretory pathway pseudopilin PulG